MMTKQKKQKTFKNIREKILELFIMIEGLNGMKMLFSPYLISSMN